MVVTKSPIIKNRVEARNVDDHPLPQKQLLDVLASGGGENWPSWQSGRTQDGSPTSANAAYYKHCTADNAATGQNAKSCERIHVHWIYTDRS